MMLNQISAECMSGWFRHATV